MGMGRMRSVFILGNGLGFSSTCHPDICVA